MPLPVRKNWAVVAAFEAEVATIAAMIRETDEEIAQLVLLQEARRKRIAEFREYLERAEKEE